MVFFEKSQPAPACLETEKAKANGDYKCDVTLNRIKEDFKNKCYINICKGELFYVSPICESNIK